MRPARTIAVVVLCLSSVGLAQEIHYDYDRTVDFSRYRTYKWVKIEANSAQDVFLDQNIRQAVDEVLSWKGFIRTEGNADLNVAYQVSIDREKVLTTWYDGGPWLWGPGWWGWGGWGVGFATTTTSTITIGTLVLDFYDPALRRLVWRGSATKTLNIHKNPEKNYESLRKTAAKLLKHVPPPSRHVS